MKKLKDLYKNRELFEQALTHRSWVNENKGIRQSNERLEFLGDAVLEFVVSKEIYGSFPDKEEGYLTSLRANLVNTQNLSAVAIKLGLGGLLYLSKGEEDGGGRNNPSLLADTLEAVIGALFIDSGVTLAEEFIKEHILSGVSEKIGSPLKDPKSRLQEFVQAKGYSTPNYEVADSTGPDHSKTFTIKVIVDGKSAGVGVGKSKSLAEQKAAEDALLRLL